MRDQHRPKHDLVNDLVALRKQVADLRDEMAGRRRVEEALRHSEEQLRVLIDATPAGLCLLTLHGVPFAASAQFARMLGYDSPAELLRVSPVVGLFTSSAERLRVVQAIERGEERVGDVLFRRKDGSPRASWTMGAVRRDPAAVALVVLEALSAACCGGTRSA
jgi:PAS domain-containing protein